MASRTAKRVAPSDPNAARRYLEAAESTMRAAWAEIETKAAQLAEQGMRFYREMQQETAA